MKGIIFRDGGREGNVSVLGIHGFFSAPSPLSCPLHACRILGGRPHPTCAGSQGLPAGYRRQRGWPGASLDLGAPILAPQRPASPGQVCHSVRPSQRPQEGEASSHHITKLRPRENAGLEQTHSAKGRDAEREPGSGTVTRVHFVAVSGRAALGSVGAQGRKRVRPLPLWG